MKNLTKKRKIILILLVISLLYFIYGFYVGHIVKSIVVSAFESYTTVDNNPYSDIISDEYYNHMVQRKDHDFTLPNTYDEYLLAPPLVIHWFTGAIVYIIYDYGYFQNGEQKSGSLGAVIKFTLKLQDGQWKVVDMYEAP